MSLLYEIVQTTNHHSVSHSLLLDPEKSSSNKIGIYWDITAQDSAVTAQYHTSSTSNPQWHQMILQGVGTQVGRHHDTHRTTPIQRIITTIQTNISGSSPANFKNKNWDPR